MFQQRGVGSPPVPDSLLKCGNAQYSSRVSATRIFRFCAATLQRRQSCCLAMAEDRVFSKWRRPRDGLKTGTTFWE